MARVTHIHALGDDITFTVELGHDVDVGDLFEISGTGTVLDSLGNPASFDTADNAEPYEAASVTDTTVVYTFPGLAAVLVDVDVDGLLTILPPLSAIGRFRAAVEEIWTSVEPANDGSDLAYRFITDFVEEKGKGRHRELQWRLPRRATTLSIGENQNDWLIDAELFLWRTPPGVSDRTNAQFLRFVESEPVDLQIAYETAGDAAFPASTREHSLLGFTFSGESIEAKASKVPRDKCVIVTFNFRVVVQEG